MGTMKNSNLIRSLVAACAMVGWSSQAAAVFIDFETDAGGAAITPEVSLLNQYASLGVVFSALEDGQSVDPTIQSPDVFFGEPAFSGNNFADNQIAGFGPSDSTNRADVFIMSFASAVSGVSFYVDPNGGADPTFNAYDSADNLLETIVVSTNGWNQITFASTNISRIEGIQPTDTWNYGIDDLAFTINEVPVPATIALLGLGLAGIGYRRRKQLEAA